MNNATCVDRVADYICECQPGYDGKNCEHEINECEADPCQNGATCTDLLNDYQCHCIPGEFLRSVYL